MKIIAFNVNGIRAILQKDFAKDVQTLNPDVLVIEETKLSEDLHIDFPFTPERLRSLLELSPNSGKAIRASRF
jgi:exonuclease III